MATLEEILDLLPDNATGAIDAADVRAAVTALWHRTDGTDPIEGLYLDTAADEPLQAAGRLHWNSEDGTLEVDTSATSALQVGYEVRLNVRNNSGATILNGRPVRITGAIGMRPTVSLDDGQGNIRGVATDDIPNNTDGSVTVIGLVRDIDTSGFAAGTTAYSSASGALTSAVSASTAGIVTNSHPTAGALLVRPFRTLGATGTTAQRPTVRPTGFAYFDTTVGRPVWWNGASWRFADGTAA